MWRVDIGDTWFSGPSWVLITTSMYYYQVCSTMYYCVLPGTMYYNVLLCITMCYCCVLLCITIYYYRCITVNTWYQVCLTMAYICRKIYGESGIFGRAEAFFWTSSVYHSGRKYSSRSDSDASTNRCLYFRPRVELEYPWYYYGGP